MATGIINTISTDGINVGDLVDDGNGNFAHVVSVGDSVVTTSYPLTWAGTTALFNPNELKVNIPGTTVIDDPHAKEPLHGFLPIKTFEFTVADDILNESNEPITIVEYANGKPGIRYWLCSCQDHYNFNVKLLTYNLHHEFLNHYLNQYYISTDNIREATCPHIEEVLKRRIKIKVK